MKKIWDIYGGIHPPERKALSTGQPLTPARLPKQLTLPLKQHIGANAEPMVAVGDHVLAGQKIAQAHGPISAALHAPTSGTIQAIEPRLVPHPSGMSDTCIIIDSDGEDRWVELEPLSNWQEVAKQELLARIADSGIVGLGGAGFPTAVKARPNEQQSIRTLILNGAECEPYITADDMLMRHRADDIIAGMQILAHLVQPEQCLIGIEDNKPEAIAAMQAAAKDTEIQVVTIPTKYPSGGEKQLIQILTGKEVPASGIPADVGVVCQNVGTAHAVARAILQGEPLVSRIVTLTGEALATPRNLEVRLGTSISDLLEQTGIHFDKLQRLVMGGPMMGFTLETDQLPVIKTTNCVLAATAEELPPPPPAMACIRCGMCEQACPAELLPQQLHWFAKAKEFDKAQHHNLFDCIECGACSYVCPSHIPLVQYFRYAKGEIRREEEDAIKAERARERFEFRKERMEREAAEKEAKRKARAEAARKAQAAKEAKGAAAGNESATDSAKDSKAAAVKAAVERAKAKKQGAAATDAGGEQQAKLKQLKIASAAAKVSLRKAESALKNAQAENQSDRIAELEEKVTKAREQVEKTEQELANVQQAVPATAAKDEAKPTAAADDDKAAKLAEVRAAVERAKAKKQQQDAGDQSASGASDPHKALKVAASATQAKLRKAEKALAAAESAGQDDQLEALRSAVEKARKKAGAAQQALEKTKTEAPAQNAAAETKPAAQAEAAASNHDDAENKAAMKKLQIAAAAAKAKVRKAEKALQAAQDAGTEPDEAEAALIQAKEQLSKAEAALAAHKQRNTETTG